MRSTMGAGAIQESQITGNDTESGQSKGHVPNISDICWRRCRAAIPAGGEKGLGCVCSTGQGNVCEESARASPSRANRPRWKPAARDQPPLCLTHSAPAFLDCYEQGVQFLEAGIGSLHHAPDPFLKHGQTRFEFAVRFILLLHAGHT